MPITEPARPQQRRYVLDSSALAAYLSGRPGHEEVTVILEAARAKRTAAYLTMFSLAELLTEEERNGGASEARHAWERIQRLPLRLIDIDRALAIAGAHIKAGYAIKAADAFAAALAERQHAVLVTNNQEYRKVEKLVAIKWLPSERSST